VNGHVTVTALAHHMLSENDKNILNATQNPPSEVEVPLLLCCCLESIYSKEELEGIKETTMLPEVPILVVKQGLKVLEGGISFPRFGDLRWEQCSTQKISIDLIADLWKANTLIVGTDPCDYSEIWENLSDEEQTELKKMGKIEIDVTKGVSGQEESKDKPCTWRTSTLCETTFLPQATKSTPAKIGLSFADMETSA
jgi:hypothetical protein